jgi:transposase-like protein
MKRSNKLYEEVQLDIVRQSLSGIKIGVLARQHDIHPETIRTWIRKFRDQVDVHELPPADQQIVELKRLQEVEEKYDKAVKILGEKELEIEILRELVKKTDPAYRKNLK